MQSELITIDLCTILNQTTIFARLFLKILCLFNTILRYFIVNFSRTNYFSL